MQSRAAMLLQNCLPPPCSESMPIKVVRRSAYCLALCLVTKSCLITSIRLRVSSHSWKTISSFGCLHIISAFLWGFLPGDCNLKLKNETPVVLEESWSFVCLLSVVCLFVIPLDWRIPVALNFSDTRIWGGLSFDVVPLFFGEWLHTKWTLATVLFYNWC